MESEELNGQFVADVHADAEDATSSLARQLVARLQRDTTDRVRLTLDRRSFNALTENLDVAEKIRVAFKRELEELEGDSWHGSVDVEDDGNVVISEATADDNQPENSSVVPLLVSVQLDDVTYELKSAFLREEAWSNVSKGSNLIYEYGDDGDGEATCISRADAQMLPHIQSTLRELGLNLEYLKGNRSAFVRAVTDTLKTHELRQTYRMANDGRELDSPECRVSMIVDYSPEPLRGAVATHWQEFTGRSLPTTPEQHAEYHPAPGVVWASFPMTLFSLLSVYGVVLLVTRLYDNS